MALSSPGKLGLGRSDDAGELGLGRSDDAGEGEGDQAGDSKSTGAGLGSFGSDGETDIPGASRPNDSNSVGSMGSNSIGGRSNGKPSVGIFGADPVSGDGCAVGSSHLALRVAGVATATLATTGSTTQRSLNIASGLRERMQCSVKTKNAEGNHLAACRFLYEQKSSKASTSPVAGQT